PTLPSPVSLTHFLMPPRGDEPITALFDLSVDNIDDLGGAREVVDQIGEHSADGDCGDWQSVGAHGRILLDRPRQSVARDLNHHLLLAGKRVFRHAISSRSACVMLSNASFSRLAVRPKTKRLRAETKGSAGWRTSDFCRIATLLHGSVVRRRGLDG